MQQTPAAWPHFKPRHIAWVAASMLGTSAHAISFDTEDGLKGSWNTTVTLGQSRRTQDADRTLVGRGFDNSGQPKGGVGSDTTDDGELNFRDSGAIFSTQLKAVSDLELKYQNYGALVRGKGWYDYTLNHRHVSQGSVNGSPMGGGRLSDEGFERGNRFDGVKLLDAMVYGSWDIANTNLSLRLGKQALNWGESLFIQGVGQVNPIDVTALRKPGAEVKEAFLPVNMLYANLGINGGPSIEAFYQFQWEKTQLDPCGTLFSGFDAGLSDRSCAGIPINGYYSTLAAGISPAAFSSWYNDAFHANNGLVLGRRDDRRPKDSGQWGLSMRYLADSLNTEFGAYYMNVHAKTPVVSVSKPDMTLTTPNAALISAGAPSPIAVLATRLQSIQYTWEYAPDIKVMGLSLATSLAGWAVGAEMSYTKGLPVQLNGSDMFAAATSGIGPLAARASALSAGEYFQGYDRLNKTQLQGNAVKAFSNVLGADSLSVAGEVAVSQANNLPSLATARYLRSFQYGFASEGTVAPCRAATTPALGNLDGCAAKGFATKIAWGYRVRAQINYSGIYPGLILAPVVSWAHDVRGYSIDSQFVEDRKVLGLALKADYQKRYFAELSYTRYGDGAKYDTLKDKDFVSVFVGTTF